MGVRKPSLVRRVAAAVSTALRPPRDVTLDRMIAEEARLTEQIQAAVHWRNILSNTGLPADGFETGRAAADAIDDLIVTRRRLRNRITYYRRHGRLPT